ncbi:MAG: glycine cleavage system protein GcvH [Planctomycetes bacterium]|nr:glycine cleavage system protein GcvH [Planctomycetota bacterium]
MASPSDRRYSQTHEWCKVNGNEAVIGITQFAADQLTDITYLELPEAGSKITAGSPCGQIESVKSASDAIAPVSGEVVAVNTAVRDEPGLVNSDPFTAGWLLRIRMSDPAEFDNLLDAAAYDALTAG